MFASNPFLPPNSADSGQIYKLHIQRTTAINFTILHPYQPLQILCIFYLVQLSLHCQMLQPRLKEKKINNFIRQVVTGRWKLITPSLRHLRGYYSNSCRHKASRERLVNCWGFKQEYEPNVTGLCLCDFRCGFINLQLLDWGLFSVRRLVFLLHASIRLHLIGRNRLCKAILRYCSRPRFTGWAHYHTIMASPLTLPPLWGYPPMWAC